MTQLGNVRAPGLETAPGRLRGEWFPSAPKLPDLAVWL